MTPLQRWQEHGFLPQLPASLEQLDLLLLTVAKSRRVQQDGIRFQSLRYIDPLLAAYVGESVTVRYDPRDMAEIRVFYQHRFLCRAVCQELAGETVSLKDILRARRQRKRDLRQMIDQRRSVVDQWFKIPGAAQPFCIGRAIGTSPSTCIDKQNPIEALCHRLIHMKQPRRQAIRRRSF